MQKYFHVDRTDFSIQGIYKAATPQDIAFQICKNESSPRTVSLLKAETRKVCTFACFLDPKTQKYKVQSLGTLDLVKGEELQFLQKNGLNAAHKKKRN